MANRTLLPVNPFLVCMMLLLFWNNAQSQDFNGSADLAKGSVPRQLTVFQFYRPQDQDRATNCLVEATKADSLGDHDKAMMYVDSSIYYDKNYGDAFLLKSIFYLDRHNFVSAHKYANMADSLGCDHRVYPVRGFIHVFLDDAEGANADAIQSVRFFPETDFTYALQGLVRLMEGDSACFEYLDKAILITKSDEFLYYRILASLIFEKVDRALDDCRSLYSLPDVDSLLAVSALAMESGLFFLTENRDSALWCMDEMVRRYPGYYLSHYVRALFLGEMDRSEEACKELMTVVSLASDNPAMLDLVSAEFIKWGKLDDALNTITDAIHLLPLQGDYYVRRANIYMLMGKDTLGFADFERAMRIDPGYFEKIIKEGNDSHSGFDESDNRQLQVLDSLISKDPKAYLYFERGEIRIKKREYEGAIADFNKVIEMQPSNAAAYHKRGNALWLSGKKKEGCIDLRKAAAMGDSYSITIVKQCCNGY